MKKYIFKFMVMAVATAMCATTLTACGGDDDDLLEPEETGTITFFEPCLEWECNTDYVQAYMSGWELYEGSINTAQVYTRKNTTTTVNYGFNGKDGGLFRAQVEYKTDNMDFFISEIKKRYNITLTEKEGDREEYGVFYGGTGTINGRAVGILLFCTTTAVSVLYFPQG